MSLENVDPSSLSWGYFTRGDPSGGVTWAKLLPLADGLAFLLYVDGRGLVGRTITTPASTTGNSADPPVLGTDHALPIAGSGWDAVRLGSTPTADHYLIGRVTDSSHTSPTTAVTHVTVTPAGDVTIGSTATFAGRSIDQLYSAAWVRLEGDGATGPVLFAHAAQVDGGMAVHTVTMTDSDPLYSVGQPIQLEEWVTQGTQNVLAARDLALLAVGTTYSLIVKGPGNGYSRDPEYIGGPTPDPWAYVLGYAFGDTELEVLNSTSAISYGVPVLRNGTPEQFNGGAKAGTGGLYGGDARTRSAPQFSAPSLSEPEVVYVNRVIDTGGTRQTVELGLQPGMVSVRGTQYTAPAVSDPGFRDEPLLATDRGLMVFRSGSYNYVNDSSQQFVWDALALDPADRVVLKGWYQQYDYSTNTQMVRLGVEDLVEAQGCVLVMVMAGSAVYLGQVRSAGYIPPPVLTGRAKDTRSHFRRPLH